MLPPESLRKADLVTSVILIAIGATIGITALGFPSGEALSGVRNDWYVSPALIPVFLGLALCIMGISLFLYALKTVDGKAFMSQIIARISGKETTTLSPMSWRFIGVTLVIILSVYLFLPRVDFILTSVIFVLTLMSMFHFKDDALVKKVLGLFLLLCLPVFLYFVTGLGKHFEKIFYFSGDIVAGFSSLAYFIALATVCARSGGPDSFMARWKTWFRLLGISIAYVFLLTPVFKFVFYIPLPREGGLIELMNILYYDVLGM